VPSVDRRLSGGRQPDTCRRNRRGRLFLRDLNSHKEFMVVVAAAGKEGFSDSTHGATGSAYRSISITDPGNAARVITVGATHRDMPHTYGVSNVFQVAVPPVTDASSLTWWLQARRLIPLLPETACWMCCVRCSMSEVRARRLVRWLRLG